MSYGLLQDLTGNNNEGVFILYDGSVLLIEKYNFCYYLFQLDCLA